MLREFVIGRPRRESYTSSMTTAVTYQHLEPRANSAYRQLYVKGTKIQAARLYRATINLEEPRTAEQLAADFDLPLPAVLEAIEYGRSNPPEVDEDFRREEARMEAAGMNDPNYKYNAKPRILSPEEIARIRSL
jgi:hypothetical protein